jgi:hypothetical protein
MKKIKAMIDSAFNKKDAIYMLETLRIFGDISDVEYEKGRKLIRKEFTKTISLIKIHLLHSRIR